MNKYLLAAGIAFAALITFQIAAHTTPVVKPNTTPLIQNTTVFHHNVAADNGDGCVTPEEIAGYRVGKFEKLGFYADADAEKFKLGVLKVYSTVKPEDMTWSAVDGYKLVGPDGKATVVITIYNKDDKGQLCAVGGGPVSEDDWNKIILAAGLGVGTPSLYHAGFKGKHS